MSNEFWTVCFTGTTITEKRSTPEQILEGLRDGDWDASDLVKGPTDTQWQPIENHPTFAEAMAELEPPVHEKPDETHLDMNPLIDVALVLLIFFILTTTYSSLRRMIEVPPAKDKDAATKTPRVEDIKDRTFKIKMWMEGSEPVILIDEQAVPLVDVKERIEAVVNNTGRKELFLTVAPDVPWGIEAKILDAAKGAGVNQIYCPLGQ